MLSDKTTEEMRQKKAVHWIFFRQLSTGDAVHMLVPNE